MQHHRAVIVCFSLAMSPGCTSGATAASRSPQRVGSAVTEASMPTIIAVETSEVAPSAMQELSGRLSLHRGCLVVLSGQPVQPFVPIWIKPARVFTVKGRVGIEQQSNRVFVGDQVRLTGTGGGPVSKAFAATRSVPPSCRRFSSFTVNGIIQGGRCRPDEGSARAGQHELQGRRSRRETPVHDV